MTISVYPITAQQAKTLASQGFNLPLLTSTRKAVTFTDDEGHNAVAYIENEKLERLGLDYIASHATLEYSEVCNEYFLKLSENDYYNDPERFPPKLITVEPFGRALSNGEQIFRDLAFRPESRKRRYYVRVESSNEPFAKWYTATSRGDLLASVRSNVTFVNAKNGQYETVTYDDWNQHAVYEKSFNPKFMTAKGA